MAIPIFCIQGPDVVSPESDLATARHRGHRIARVTRQVILGRTAEALLKDLRTARR
jgi:hypothetical protein